MMSKERAMDDKAWEEYNEGGRGLLEVSKFG
jgi:hypothetical protein